MYRKSKKLQTLFVILYFWRNTYRDSGQENDLNNSIVFKNNQMEIQSSICQTQRWKKYQVKQHSLIVYVHLEKKNLNINRYYICHSLDVISHTCVPPRVFLFFMKTINKVEIEIVSDWGYRSVFRLTLLFFLTSVMFSDSLSHLYV